MLLLYSKKLTIQITIIISAINEYGKKIYNYNIK